MYVYVDESGNTGNKIFDPNQPVFFTAAMITKVDFDLSWKSAVSAAAKRVGASALHANELGVGRIEEIADDLLKIVKRADARFFVSRLEKRFLAASKVFDTYFDAGENIAVPWQVYSLRQLRLMMVFKLAAYVITEEIAQLVWSCLTAPSEKQSKEAFVEGAKAMLAQVDHLPDERSRVVVRDALVWAVENPENFHTHTKGGQSGHSPNFVAFTNLMHGVQKVADAWGRPVRQIVHDQQPQFEKTFREWHALFSTPALAKMDPVRWPGDEAPYSMSVVPGSTLRMSSEEDSAGLQVVDVILWLNKRVMSKKDIGARSAALLRRVYRRGYQADLSFEAVGASAEQKWQDTFDAPISDEQHRRAAGLIHEEEERRQAAMSAYAERKSKGL